MPLSVALLVIAVLGLTKPAYSADDAAREAAKAKLAPLQNFVGEWKGVGQRERGKNEGAWIEKSAWAWKFQGDAAAISFSASDAKFLTGGAITPTKNDGEYQLTVTGPDGKTSAVYTGKLEESKLVLECAEPAAGLPVRISLRLVAEGKRLVALYEAKSTASDRLVRLAEVGYTRVGSNFGQGSQGPECVITGGLGTITVTHAGKTYYVCCTGCKDYFDENPQRAIDEYLARKEEEKKKAEPK
ncbi:MAG TPA: TRASH domain-containing protein [Pirellulaceae bacterium]|nr:TRASH domain-containing protein [Pirellulaceae bacterium]